MTQDSPYAAAAGTTAPLLSARRVEKRYGRTVALRAADVCIAPGEIVAIMGPSGSGKSTLLHCLAGILTPDGGSIEYYGRRVDTMNDNERSRLRRTDFGFVFQFGQLIGELSAVENVALPLLMNGIRRRAAVSTARLWLERMGLAELGDRRPHEMSGGQAQRIAVARALATKPRIVFADEPTGSLDSITGMAVLDAFTAAARSEQAAVVIVTHEPRVAAYASRTIIVRDGTVGQGELLGEVVAR